MSDPEQSTLYFQIPTFSEKHPNFVGSRTNIMPDPGHLTSYLLIFLVGLTIASLSTVRSKLSHFMAKSSKETQSSKVAEIIQARDSTEPELLDKYPDTSHSVAKSSDSVHQVPSREKIQPRHLGTKSLQRLCRQTKRQREDLPMHLRIQRLQRQRPSLHVPPIRRPVRTAKCPLSRPSNPRLRPHVPQIRPEHLPRCSHAPLPEKAHRRRLPHALLDLPEEPATTRP